MARLSVLAFALLTMLVVVACGGDDDGGAVDQSIGVPTGTRQPTQIIVTPPGELPDSFPADFPVFTGASLTRASDLEDRFIVGWLATAPLQDVKQFYSEQLASGTWSIESTDDRGEGQPAIFEFSGGDDDEYSGQVAVTDLGGESVTIIVNLDRSE